MATERFSKEEFEATLPVHKTTGIPIWEARGCIAGEFQYFLPVNALAGVQIRSSVHCDGFAAGTGEDSIRLWLADPLTGAPLGGKLSKYIKRTSGWRVNIVDQLRTLYRLAGRIRVCTKCNSTTKVWKAKQGERKGSMFISCGARECKSFEWVETSN